MINLNYMQPPVSLSEDPVSLILIYFGPTLRKRDLISFLISMHKTTQSFYRKEYQWETDPILQRMLVDVHFSKNLLCRFLPWK